MDQKELTHPVTSKKRQVNEGTLEDEKRNFFCEREREGRRRGNEVEITVFSSLVHSLLELTWTLHTFLKSNVWQEERERLVPLHFSDGKKKTEENAIPEKVRRKKTDEDG